MILSSVVSPLTHHPLVSPLTHHPRSSGGGVREDATHSAHLARPLPHIHDRGVAHSALGWFLRHCLGQHLLQVTWADCVCVTCCWTLGGVFTCCCHDYTGSLPKTSSTASRRSLPIPCHMTTETAPTPRGRTLHKSWWQLTPPTLTLPAPTR